MKRFGRTVLVILADVLVLFLAWFFAIILSGKNFLLSEENVNKILFCSFDNIMEEEFIF